MIIIDNFCKSFAEALISLSPTEMSALTGIVGTLCTINLNQQELNILGSFIQAVGQIIIVAEAQASNQESYTSISSEEFNKFKKEIEYKINYLYQKTNKTLQ